MHPETKRWPQYWRASLADGQGANPDWKKQISTDSAGDGPFLLMQRGEWNQGRVSNVAMVAALFHSKSLETQVIQLAVYPRVYARKPSHAADIRDGLPIKLHTLTARVLISREGLLSVLTRNDEVALPVVNRSVLSPLDIEGHALVLGDIENLDNFLFNTFCPRDDWPAFLEYCDALEREVCNLQLLREKGYIEQAGVPFLSADGRADFSARLLQLYDAVLDHDGELPLLEALSHGKPNERQTPCDADTFGKRSGHMHPENSLAAAQRISLGAVLALEDGESLAVNGPPGTGKTTLLQSVVASFWINPILGNEAFPVAPVIAACSTNNQAVTNIIESFEMIPAEEGNSLGGRWLDGWYSYGIYMASEEKAKNSVYATKQKLANFEYASAEKLPACETFFLDRFRDAFPGRSVIDVASCAKELRAEIKTRHALLESVTTCWRGLCAAIAAVASAAELMGVDEDKMVAIHENVALKAEAETELRSAQETQWVAILGSASFLSNMFAWIPQVAASRDMKALAFLRGVLGRAAKFEKGLYKKLLNILADRTVEAENSSTELREIVSSIHLKLDERERAQGAWALAIKTVNGMRASQSSQKILLDAQSTLEEVDRVCDTVMRRSLFLLATHYWEARWLMCLKATVALYIKHERYESGKRSRVDKASLESYRRRAMICPVFVSTFHSLPGNFSKSIRLENGGWQSNPFWNFIDLLVVDEAGQVSPEIGAVGFALARKALVVGDALQIEPVWNVPKMVDLGNAKALDLSSATKAGRAAFLAGGMSASSGSLIKVAQRASPFHGDLPLGRGMHLYEHRRCDDAIIQYCNDLCYQGALIPKRGNARRPAPEVMHLPALGYARVPGREERPLSGSVRNPIEAAAVARWIADNRAALESFYAGESIEKIVAIITPYCAQSAAIKCELEALNLPASITIGTVHSLQGAERPVILFSPANSRHAENKDFFWNSQPNLLNVAVSRAKDSFLVFSDMSMFDASMTTPAGVLGAMLLKADANEVSVNLTSVFQAALAKQGSGRVVDTIIQSITTVEDHRNVLRRAFEESRRSVVMSSPWITESALQYDQVVEMIKTASERSVKVTIYTDSTLNIENGEAKARSFTRSLNALGAAGAVVVPVKMIHCKVLYCDDDWKCVGSFNWLSAQREGRYVRRDVSTLIEGSDFVAGDRKEELESLDALRA